MIYSYTLKPLDCSNVYVMNPRCRMSREHHGTVSGLVFPLFYNELSYYLRVATVSESLIHPDLIRTIIAYFR